MTKLHPAEVKDKLAKERVCLVDVRSFDEFRSGHVPGALSIPLEDIESGKAAITRDNLVILSCQMGGRSAKAYGILRSRGFENVAELDGGFAAWKSQGYPVSRLTNSIPIFRQVLITAGSLVFLGTLLGLTVHPGFFAVPLFFGAGLTFAGATGFCGMAILLEKMPWNKASSRCS